jgi:HemY protein
MKFLFWILALFTAAVAVTLASHNPGYVQVVYPPYRMELSLSLFVFVTLALFVLTYFAVHLILEALRLPEYVRNFRAEQAQQHGQHALMEALTAFFEGRYSAAEKSAARALELGDSTDLTPVVAARAAHELGEFAKRDAYLASVADTSIGVATSRLLAQTSEADLTPR